MAISPREAAELSSHEKGIVNELEKIDTILQEKYYLPGAGINYFSPRDMEISRKVFTTIERKYGDAGWFIKEQLYDPLRRQFFLQLFSAPKKKYIPAKQRK